MQLGSKTLSAALAAALLAPAAAAQVHANVSGRVVDMSLDASGDVLYCTVEGEVGTIAPDGGITVLATAATAPFPCDLVAVAPAPGGDVAVLDKCSDIYLLPGGTTPAVQQYEDLYIINQPSDLIVDATGNFVTVAQTATSGVRALQWVSPDGSDWAYYLIEHHPVAVVADPLDGNLILADANGGGALRVVNASDESHPTSPLDTTTQAGFGLASQDGDMAGEVSGDVLTAAGGSLHHYDRSTGISTVLASGFTQLRGLAIAPSSGALPSPSGWSAYVAEHAGPSATDVVEVPDVEAPASVTAAALGTVPDRGIQLMFFLGLHAFDLEVDRNGDLLISGDQWGSNFEVRRIDLPSLAVTTVAEMSDGLSGRVEGVCVAADEELYALTSAGHVQRIDEAGPTVSDYFTDPMNVIGTGKDLALDRDGTLYVGNYFSWSNGSLVEIATNGVGSALLSTEETRGVTPDPFTARLILTEWKDSGFNGDVDLYDPVGGGLGTFTGFDELNFTNAAAWGDGKVCQDVEGNLYVCSEDDFSLLRYDRETHKKVRIGSGYINHPTGVVIAESTPTSGSTTGYSLYVAEWNYLWEIPSVPAPAPRLLDAGAPPVGRAVGWVPASVGKARALVADPLGGAVLVSTSLGRLVRVDVETGEATTVSASPQPRDMTALGVTSTGHVLVATFDGVIFDVDPAAGYGSSVFYNDPLQGLRVHGMTVDGEDRPLLVHRDAATVGGELLRVELGALEPLAFTAKGVGAAIDPLTGEVFVAEEGTGLDSGGEVLRVDPFASPPTTGHLRLDVFSTFAFGGLTGGIALDDAGNVYVATEDDGRVWRVDRASGERTVVAGNYDRPAGLILAPGTPGVAGPQGTSLYVLDANTVYEVGVDGLPAPAPPETAPGLAPPADLRVHGTAELGELLPVSISHPSDANRTYLILPSLIGKEPGLPLAIFGDPSDPRVLPSNLNTLWSLAGDPGAMPGFFGTLDPLGATPGGTGLALPDDPVLLGLDVFLDLAWLALEPTAQNGVSTVGGTAQIYLGGG